MDIDRHLKDTELEILKSFIEACDKLNIEYFALGGTCLGAVRHNGFIPWDDDIDVGLKRKDYDLFMSEGQKLLPEGLFLQNHNTDPEYVYNFAKIRKSDTTFIETSLKNLNINHGVYIDVFPLDYCPEGKFSYRLINFKEKFLSNCIGNVFTPQCGKSRKNLIIQKLCLRLYGSVEKAVLLEEKLYRSCSHSGLIANFGGAWGEKEIMAADIFDHTEKIPFENIMINVPYEYDRYLKHVYGNYMELPPVEKRVAHHFTEVIDLEKSYTHYR